ncbi:MAG: NFYB/HAP3 family transcription factor subunit [Candidatus Aenigmarchaeota archaeon]|nr:NFYB/HAP3 family transcription factor subunit [Candidatus Aenigmarchaeota archaeon]
MLEKFGLKAIRNKETYKSQKSRKETIHLHTVLRLSKKFGAERMSKEAAQALSVYLAEELKRVVQEADKLTRHAGRKTIMAEDIELAVRRVK